jgi:hypothetical protein
MGVDIAVVDLSHKPDLWRGGWELVCDEYIVETRLPRTVFPQGLAEGFARM